MSTNSERLLLAQAVYEFGSQSWPKVSKLLQNHPLIAHPKSFFTSCNSMYANLMDDAGLDSHGKCEFARQAPSHLKLAQIQYQARVEELRELILTEESKFKKVLAEIDEIRAGLWDDRIKDNLGISSPKDSGPLIPREPAEQVEDAPITEIELAPDVSPQLSSPRSITPLEEKEEEGNAKDQTMEIIGRTVPEVGAENINEPDETLKTAEPFSTDLEEDEVSFQLAPAPSSPLPSDSAAIADRNLVPMYPHRESSPSVEAKQELAETAEYPTKADSMKPITPSPSPEPSQDLKEREASRPPEPEESTSLVGSEESLLTTQHPTQVVVSPPAEKSPPPAESPISEPAGVATPSEPAVESPKPVEVDSGVQTRQGKRKAESEAESKREKKKAREQSEPEEEEPAPVSRKQRGKQAQNADQLALRRFQNLIGLVHSQISQHRNGNIFHNPIKHSEAPDYHDIVKRPMDLKTIKTRIKDGVISSSLEYQRDVYLMFANSMMYNRPNSDIYNMAEEMMLESEHHINSFRQTEGWNNRQ